MDRKNRPKVNQASRVDLILNCMLEAFRKAGCKPMAVAVVLTDRCDIRTHLLITRTADERSRRRVVTWVTDSICAEAGKARTAAGIGAKIPED